MAEIKILAGCADFSEKNTLSIRPCSKNVRIKPHIFAITLDCLGLRRSVEGHCHPGTLLNLIAKFNSSSAREQIGDSVIVAIDIDQKESFYDGNEFIDAIDGLEALAKRCEKTEEMIGWVLA